MTTKDKSRFYIELGNLLNTARKNAGLSQKELAQRSSMSRTSIINIEKGRQHPPIHLLWKFSQILDVNATDLIPIFSNSEESGELNTYFERIIKKTTDVGIIDESSTVKINTFINNS
jgi:transcriptional regulator with XRE-family HTH domain